MKNRSILNLTLSKNFLEIFRFKYNGALAPPIDSFYFFGSNLNYSFTTKNGLLASSLDDGVLSISILPPFSSLLSIELSTS